MTPDGPLLFVYGTLRPGAEGQGAPMMQALVARSTHVGRGDVRGTLYSIDWFPGMVESTRTDDRVIGDVLRLPNDEGLLAELDAYEGVDYARLATTVTMANGEAIAAWTYVWIGALDGARRIESGDFLAHAQAIS